jgi:predicted MPP superfamily phosphohydrolase
MQVYLARSVHHWLLTLPLGESTRVWTERILLAALIYFNISIPARMIVRNVGDNEFVWLKYLVVVPGLTWLITMIMMFALFVTKDVAGWIYGWLQKDAFDAGRRTFLQSAGAISFVAPLVLTGYGALYTARNYKIKHVELKYPNLPRAFDGVTIAQISDIHSGIYMDEKEMARIKELIDRERPQIAVITGDFVDTRAKEIEPVARIFSKLKTDFGVYGCMGNHDVFDDYSALSAQMKKSGIIMLENTNKTVETVGERISLIGVNDSGRRYNLANLNEALSGVEEGTFKLLLAHRPEFFPRAKEAGIDLQLSGHTHGGQIGFNVAGIPINLVHLFHEYPQGLYEENGSKLYVNSGVGMAFAPVRIGIDPEITLITLRSAT